MRKIIMLLLLMLVSMTLHSQILKVDYELELGYVPIGAFGYWDWEPLNEYYKIKADIIERVFYIELTTRVWLFDFIYAGGAMTVQMSIYDDEEPSDSIIPISFNPTFTNYNFNAGIRLGMLDIFYEHDCTHAQTTYQFDYRVTSLWGEGWIDRVGVRFSGTF